LSLARARVNSDVRRLVLLGVKHLAIFIYIYAGIYALFSIWTIFDDLKHKEPWWDQASDLILLPLGGIGMLLFLFGINDPLLQSAWKIIAVLIVAGQLMTNVVARHLTFMGKTELNPRRISQWSILGADLFTIMLLAPMFVLNVMLAFS